jgi:hypothetical protein
METIFRAFLTAAVCLIAFTAPARAATVTLAWDANPEGDATGYLVSYGTSSQHYEHAIDAGSLTTCQFTALDPEQVYYFAVQAYDSAGRVSSFSAEVVLSPSVAPTVPAAADLTVTSLTSALVAPQEAGVSVGFAAAASRGVKPYEYQWLIFDGTIWSVAEDWSLNSTFVWTPQAANAHYRVGVMMRSATSTEDGGESPSAGGSMAFPITDPGPGKGNEHRRFPPHPHEFRKK